MLNDCFKMFVDCTVVPWRTTWKIPQASWINVLQVLFYGVLLARACFASCEYYYAVANICLNVNIFQFYRVYLRFGRLVVDFGVWMVLAF